MYCHYLVSLSHQNELGYESEGSMKILANFTTSCQLEANPLNWHQIDKDTMKKSRLAINPRRL